MTKSQIALLLAVVSLLCAAGGLFGAFAVGVPAAVILLAVAVIVLAA
jgi:hypothetical protein